MQLLAVLLLHFPLFDKPMFLDDGCSLNGCIGRLVMLVAGSFSIEVIAFSILLGGRNDVGIIGSSSFKAVELG